MTLAEPAMTIADAKAKQIPTIGSFVARCLGLCNLSLCITIIYSWQTTSPTLWLEIQKDKRAITPAEMAMIVPADIIAAAITKLVATIGSLALHPRISR